jgi:hypothetical protein
MIIPPKITKLPVIWEMRKLVLYFYSSLKAIFIFRSICIIYDSIRYFPIWWKYLQKEGDPLKNDLPWITFKAAQFLEKILKNDLIVFEYGSGSSTLYFSRRVAMLVSIEHDPDWYNHIQQTINELAITNTKCKLIEPELLSENQSTDYLSQSTLYLNKHFEFYVKSIDTYPDRYFDIILIDGRSRPKCIAHAKNKIKQGGYLVVDNSERTYYFEGNDFLWDKKEWKINHFTGPVPYSFDFSKTSFFQKK